MSAFQQFELIEIFQSKDVEKLPDSLRFDKGIKEEGKLYRLLLGSVAIKNNVTENVLSQRINYSVLGKKNSKRFSKSMFVEHISRSTSLADIDKYFTTNSYRNTQLFKDLINEFCFYFHYSSIGIHTLSFLHIYRVLERISYTFPMLFASKTSDYIGTFNKLQNYFKGANSELKFFGLFMEEFFISEFLETRVKFNITACNEEVRENYYKIIKRLSPLKQK